MKTMTCQQLGGACDLAHHGATADDVIKAQDRHLREAVAGGDTAHEEAFAAMKGRWRRPISASTCLPHFRARWGRGGLVMDVCVAGVVGPRCQPRRMASPGSGLRARPAR